MPTYINEDVLSLPEQVQKNKEDIATNAAAIAEIDPSAITAVIAQVGTNTTNIATNANDITNLQNGLGATNLAVGGLATRVGTNEGDITTLQGGLAGEILNRQALIYKDANNDYNITNATNDINLTATAGDINMTSGVDVEITATNSVDIENGSNSIILSNNGIATTTSADMSMSSDTLNVYASDDVEITALNDLTIKSNSNTNNLSMDSSKVSITSVADVEITADTHILKLDTTGALTIDGNPVGGGATLYEHNVSITMYDSDNNYLIDFIIINESSETLDTWIKISNELNTEGYNAVNRYLNANGGGLRSSNVIFVYGIYHVTLSGYIKFKYMNITGTFGEAQLPISGLSISDNVHAL